MGINLPWSGNNYIPKPSLDIARENPMLYAYLMDLKRALEDIGRGAFANTFTVSTAINSGTSGTFVISSGGSIVVTSGIVLTVTS